MLKKDQYNQDEYNNYYKQETEGAEITSYGKNESGFMGKTILFLGLIALGIAGYFGFKAFNTTDSNTVTKEKIVIEKKPSKVTESITETEKEVSTDEINKDKVVEEKIEPTIQEEVATEVQEKLENKKKMSTDDISKIVNLVMNKMEKEKVETTRNDTDLLTALEESNNIIETKTKNNKTVVNNSESAVEKNIEEINNNNKVTLDKDEDLTELSEQIKKLLNMAGVSNESSKATTTKTNNNTETNYAQSIRKEIKVRTNEMRIIVVKPGDTLNKIAKRAYGNSNSYQKIFDANPDISGADKIYVGQKLRIPK